MASDKSNESFKGSIVTTDSSVEMTKARDDALRNLTGKQIELRIAEQAKLRPDQIGLLGGFLAIPLMIIVMIF